MGLILRKISELIRVNTYYLQENYCEWKSKKGKGFDWIKDYEQFKKQYSPYFVLSTGRCGTKLLTLLFALDKSTCTYHSDYLIPNPLLKLFQNQAYHAQDRKALTETLEAARGELIYRAYRTGRRYIETNSRATFFADAAIDLFPNAKFIHLVRHPTKFAISFIKRGVFQNEDMEDIGLIKKEGAEWERLELIEKIGWLWNETQAFIERFKQMHPEQIITVRSEDLFQTVETSRTVFDFLGLSWPGDPKVRRLIARPVNKQTSGSFPEHKEWNEKDKALLEKSVPLARQYNYSL